MGKPAYSVSYIEEFFWERYVEEKNVVQGVQAAGVKRLNFHLPVMPNTSFNHHATRVKTINHD